MVKIMIALWFKSGNMMVNAGGEWLLMHILNCRMMLFDSLIDGK